MKVYVKWDYTDDYGRAYEDEATYKWFDSKNEADAWMAEMRKGNGGYFKVFKVAEGDYNKFLRMEELKKELAELQANF